MNEMSDEQRALTDLVLTFRNVIGSSEATKHGEYHAALLVLERAGYCLRNGVIRLGGVEGQ